MPSIRGPSEVGPGAKACSLVGGRQCGAGGNRHARVARPGDPGHSFGAGNSGDGVSLGEALVETRAISASEWQEIGCGIFLAARLIDFTSALSVDPRGALQRLVDRAGHPSVVSQSLAAGERAGPRGDCAAGGVSSQTVVLARVLHVDLPVHVPAPGRRTLHLLRDAL